MQSANFPKVFCGLIHRTIDGMPVSVESQYRFGHLEGDSLVSRKSTVVLNSLVELKRKSAALYNTKLNRFFRGVFSTAWQDSIT